MRPVLAPIAALCLAACASGTPGLAPPGLDEGAPRLYFPVGLDVSKDGTRLYVANSNFDRAYSSGTLASFPTAAFDEAAAAPGRRLAALPAGTTVAVLDSFAGPLRTSADGSAVVVVTRDHDLLHRIPLDAAGLPACDPASCSRGALDLGARGLVDPFALALAEIALPGVAAAEPVVLVSHLTPESTGSGAGANPARVAVIPERLVADPDPFAKGALSVEIGAPASSALAFAPDTRRLFVGGCLQRVSAEQVIACGLNQDSQFFRSNPLRSLLPEAGAPSVDVAGLGAALGGGDTTDLAVSTDGRLLYVLTARPSALLVLDLASKAQPATRAIVPLAQSPSRLHVLRRATGDVVVTTATQSNAVLVVDPFAGRVLAQLSAVGKGPYELASHATAAGDRVYVGLFSGCGVAALDVPADHPDDAALVGTVGACP